MTVVNTLDDERFNTHPFVVDEPKLRFYSGAPLMTKSGQKIGMLCVHDIRPRPDFDARKQSVLAQLAGIVMDEIDFHRIETERRMLINELSHRVKNVISVVQGVAKLSGRGHAAAEPFVAAFCDRLNAISSAHDRLVEANWNEAALLDIIEGVVAPHQNLDGDRIVLEIAPMTVDPSFAQSMALLVHELVTNAIKYGALAVPLGRVVFSAQRAMHNGTPMVDFIWTESGGAAAVKPLRSGFGHRMLESVVRQKDGSVAFDWLPSGLVCRFTFSEQALASA